MRLFNEEGHITDEGFQQLIGGQADELSRLEISEHMDFCDQCVERYSELLTADLLWSRRRILRLRSFSGSAESRTDICEPFSQRFPWQQGSR